MIYRRQISGDVNKELDKPVDNDISEAEKGCSGSTWKIDVGCNAVLRL